MRTPAARFLVSGLVGLAFFMLPIPDGDRWTVAFDLVVRWVTGGLPRVVAASCLFLIFVGGLASVAAAVGSTNPWVARYRTGPVLTVARAIGMPVAVVYVAGWGPSILLDPGVAGLMWNTLAFSIAVIVPLGAAFLGLLVNYGTLEFVGTLMRRVMRPLFRLPGRAALDSLTSWVGSYSVGLYLTRRLTREGYYNRREAYTIVTCFSTVSIGFVGVVCQTLGLLPLFPIVFATYFVAVYLLTAILVRTWPIIRIPTAYLADAKPEDDVQSESGSLLGEAWTRAVEQASHAAGFIETMRKGFVDGLALASTILGSVLAVGTAALLLARETPLFDLLGRPLVPILAVLGLPDAELLGPAALVGITEMYIPALLVEGAALPARFFVCVLSISQLIFFSSVAPMILDMFRDIPVRARELVALFLMRTAMLIPLLATATVLLEWGGVLG